MFYQRKIFLVFLAVAACLVNFIFAQTEDDVCLMSEQAEIEATLPPSTQVRRGGREITANGELKVLVVFVRFKDDTENTNYWPDYTVLPTWAQNIVDPVVPSNGIYTPLNLSDYFDRASGGDGQGNLGTFRVVGDVYYVTTDQNKSYYSNASEPHDAVNEHVLTKMNNYVNFANYDNWVFRKNDERSGPCKLDIGLGVKNSLT